MGGGNSTVESHSSKVMVAGSNPVPRSKSLQVAKCEVYMRSNIEFVRETDAIRDTGEHMAAVNYEFVCDQKTVTVQVTSGASLELDLKRKGENPREYAKHFLEYVIDEQGIPVPDLMRLDSRGMSHLLLKMNAVKNS